MSSLLAAARQWVVDVQHPHTAHLLRTEHWLLELEPGASERLRLAAVLHDIERAFPDPQASWDSARDWDSPVYNRWHQDRCADIAAGWLRSQGAPADLVEGVERLVRAHEEGGWAEADLLQAADSLSFLDTLVPLVVAWVESGRATPERGAAKLHDSLERMRPGMELARALGEPMLRAGLAAVEAARARVAR